MRKLHSAAAVLGTGSLLTGGLIFAQTQPGSAQKRSYDVYTISGQVQSLEMRVARLEQRIKRLESGSNARWRKIRDDGQRIVMIDNETGTVRIINTISGSVREPKVGK